MAKLYFLYGAMNSGKSSHLMQTAHNYEERGMRVILLKPAIDTKGEDTITSRIGLSRKINYFVDDSTDVIETVKEDIEANKHLDLILFDEIQFAKPEQIDQLFYIAHNYNIPIMCFGLRTDFKLNSFKGSARLLAIADTIIELKTICPCGNKATINMRFKNGKPVFSGEQIVIDDGGTIEYQSYCPKCYFNMKKEAGK